MMANERLRATGKSVSEKIKALCDLCNDLGIKLTAGQIKQLDALEAKQRLWPDSDRQIG
jgi:hypothetical protein